MVGDNNDLLLMFLMLLSLPLPSVVSPPSLVRLSPSLEFVLLLSLASLLSLALSLIAEPCPSRGRSTEPDWDEEPPTAAAAAKEDTEAGAPLGAAPTSPFSSFPGVLAIVLVL